MQKFSDKYYVGVVVSSDVDPNRAGAVRVKIIGVTDELDIKDQPFAIPAINPLTGVPTKGTYLEIRFDEDDIHKPKYFNASAERNYLPADYVNDGYPDIVVGNLGGDFFSMRHDRKKKDTLINHPSESDILWDNFGRIAHDSEHAYEENADQVGTANEEIGGSRILPVLTQGTVDIFTCRVFGAGKQAMQGSEYLFTAHISKNTVSKIKNLPTDSSVETDLNNPEEQIDVSEYKKVLQEDVLWKKSPYNGKSRNVADINTVVVTASGSDNFLAATSSVGLANDIKGNDQSVHYILGKAIFDPSTSGSTVGTPNELEGDLAFGFIQTVDLEYEASWFSADVKSTAEPEKSVHTNSVVVLVIGKDLTNLTPYQTNTIKNIIKHVKNVVKEANGTKTASIEKIQI